MTLFYIKNASEKISYLPNEESKHAIKVLRLKTGDLLAITNGKGDILTAKITFPSLKRCEIIVLDTKHQQQREFHIHLAVAPTKLNDRYEWLLEKLTEIGIDEITPIICERSERKVLKVERMNRIIISAVKQSWKAYKPVIHPPIKFTEFIKKNQFDQQFITHCSGGCGSSRHIKHLLKPQKSIGVLIGPEGDFTEKEIELATKMNWLKAGLGNHRLRTETAALVACMSIHIAND